MSNHREDDTHPRARLRGPPGGPRSDGHGSEVPRNEAPELNDQAFESILGWIDHMTEVQLLRVQCKVNALVGEELKDSAFVEPDPYNTAMERDTAEFDLGGLAKELEPEPSS